MVGGNIETQGNSDITRQNQKTSASRVLLANVIFLLVVLSFGFYANSLVLLASGVHLVADTAGLTIAYFAILLSARPASQKYSFGLVRAEVLGALINGSILVATSVWIIFEATKDLLHPHAVSPLPVIILGFAGLVISAFSMRSLQQNSGKSLNMRAGVIHMAGDTAGWFFTILSGVAILIFSFYRADAIGSILISLLILASSWQILAHTVSVLLESTPRDITLDEIRIAIESDPQILNVHHLHLWNLASDTKALSTHILMQDGATLHLSQTKVQQIKDLLKSRFGIDHVTIEVECHNCGDIEHN
ncbi:MAG: cation transporter [Acidimicrobiaceae bacterium]|nr:cation transporter [Acidimicrobiaceae bacterium]